MGAHTFAGVEPQSTETAELIQADMAQVGVKVVIVPVEGRFQEARLMDMSHDLTLSGWATDSNDPDSFFRPLLSCAAPFADQPRPLVRSEIRQRVA